MGEAGVRVVGAGLGRTGTTSLAAALETLLGDRCYQMQTVFEKPEDVAGWRDAIRGRPPDWVEWFTGCSAIVDWPAASFYREIADAFPEALVVLSTRDPEAWWKSASQTIFPATLASDGPWREMMDELFARRFTNELGDRGACIAAYERHNDAVRSSIPRDRLLEWRAGEGWEPLCVRLGTAVPAEPFPHLLTTQDFLATYGR